MGYSYLKRECYTKRGRSAKTLGGNTYHVFEGQHGGQYVERSDQEAE